MHSEKDRGQELLRSLSRQLSALLIAERHVFFLFFFFLNDPATPEIYPLPLHDALPIYSRAGLPRQQVYRTFSAHARALSAPRWNVDGSRTKRHAGRAAKRKTGGAGKIVGGTRARAEQSVRRGAPLGGGAARLPAASARCRPQLDPGSGRLRPAGAARRRDSLRAEARSIQR